MPLLLQVPFSSLKQLFNAFHCLSTHPHHPTWASILLDTDYLEVLPVFQEVWEARRGPSAVHIWAAWGAAALANTHAVVLWQLFASQAQSLLLMTTVAMPVFSKKNETVSGGREAADLCGGQKPKGLWANIWPLGNAANLWQGGWMGDNLSVRMLVCRFFKMPLKYDASLCFIPSIFKLSLVWRAWKRTLPCLAILL